MKRMSIKTCGPFCPVSAPRSPFSHNPSISTSPYVYLSSVNSHTSCINVFELICVCVFRMWSFIYVQVWLYREVTEQTGLPAQWAQRHCHLQKHLQICFRLRQSESTLLIFKEKLNPLLKNLVFSDLQWFDLSPCCTEVQVYPRIMWHHCWVCFTGATKHTYNHNQPQWRIRVETLFTSFTDWC